MERREGVVAFVEGAALELEVAVDVEDVLLGDAGTRDDADGGAPVSLAEIFLKAGAGALQQFGDGGPALLRADGGADAIAGQEYGGFAVEGVLIEFAPDFVIEA